MCLRPARLNYQRRVSLLTTRLEGLVGGLGPVQEGRPGPRALGPAGDVSPRHVDPGNF